VFKRPKRLMLFWSCQVTSIASYSRACERSA
jgi:hypothetical protein